MGLQRPWRPRIGAQAIEFQCLVGPHRFVGFLENDCIQRELWQIWRSPVVNERLLVGWRETAG